MPKNNIEVPRVILKEVCRYCEDNSIYDKLANYKDFYYIIKRLLQNRRVIAIPK